MKLYRTAGGVILEDGGKPFFLEEEWDRLFNRKDLLPFLAQSVKSAKPLKGGFDPETGELFPPIVSQEVWAAGVTYLRSRAARVEESKETGGGDLYSRVYEADRPELFFKATPHRVAGHRQKVRIRKDSKWSVPEPELALAINSVGKIFGYAICNDMSSRDIEGENPLYLPQAKVYDGSCALGPCVLVADEPPPKSVKIGMEIRRKGTVAFSGSVGLDQIKRSFGELVGWLLRDNSFPNGCYLSTGTGIVPPNEFTLHSGDEIRITILPIGTLSNTVM